MKSITDVSKRTNIVLNIIMILVTLACLLPMLLVLIVSFTDEQVVALNGYSFFPAKWSVESYAFVLKNSMTVIKAYGITILTTTVGTIAGVLTMTLFAYAISRKTFIHRNKFAFFLFFTMLFNAGLVPWYYMYASVLNLKNTIPVLIIPRLVVPFLVIVMRTFISTTISDSIIESGKVDGASEYKVFVSLVMPLLKPGLATVGLFASIAFWNDWYLPMVFITDPDLRNLQALLQAIERSITFLSSANMNMSVDLSEIPGETARMAMAMVAIGPVIFVYPFFQKYFVKGLTVGAVKG